MSAPLAPEGQEWQPGRDYDIVGELGGGEGRMSVVFHIALRPPRRGEYALKMVIHYVGETAAERRGHAHRCCVRSTPKQRDSLSASSCATCWVCSRMETYCTQSAPQSTRFFSKNTQFPVMVWCK